MLRPAQRGDGNLSVSPLANPCPLPTAERRLASTAHSSEKCHRSGSDGPSYWQSRFSVTLKPPVVILLPGAHSHVVLDHGRRVVPGRAASARILQRPSWPFRFALFARRPRPGSTSESREVDAHRVTRSPSRSRQAYSSSLRECRNGSRRWCTARCALISLTIPELSSAPRRHTIASKLEQRVRKRHWD